MNRTANRIGLIITVAILLSGLALIWSQTVSAAITITAPPAQNAYTAGTSQLSIDSQGHDGKTITFKARLVNSDIDEAKIIVVFGGNAKELTLTTTNKNFSVSFPETQSGFPDTISIKTYRGQLEAFLNDDSGGGLFFFNNPDAKHSVWINNLNVLDFESHGQCDL